MKEISPFSQHNNRLGPNCSLDRLCLRMYEDSKEGRIIAILRASLITSQKHLQQMQQGHLVSAKHNQKAYLPRHHQEPS